MQIRSHRIEKQRGGPGRRKKMRKILVIQRRRVKYYLWERSIQLRDGGKRKKKADLFTIGKKAAAMKQIKLASSVKKRKKLLEGKLLTKGRQIFKT